MTAQRIPHSHAVKRTVHIHAHVASLSPDDVALGSTRIGAAINDLHMAGFDVDAGDATMTKRPKMRAAERPVVVGEGAISDEFPSGPVDEDGFIQTTGTARLTEARHD